MIALVIVGVLVLAAVCALVYVFGFRMGTLTTERDEARAQNAIFRKQLGID